MNNDIAITICIVIRLKRHVFVVSQYHISCVVAHENHLTVSSHSNRAMFVRGYFPFRIRAKTVVK